MVNKWPRHYAAQILALKGRKNVRERTSAILKSAPAHWEGLIKTHVRINWERV
jgi:hypothetical protein